MKKKEKMNECLLAEGPPLACQQTETYAYI